MGKPVLLKITLKCSTSIQIGKGLYFKANIKMVHLFTWICSTEAYMWQGYFLFRPMSSILADEFVCSRHLGFHVVSLHQERKTTELITLTVFWMVYWVGYCFCTQGISVCSKITFFKPPSFSRALNRHCVEYEISFYIWSYKSLNNSWWLLVSLYFFALHCTVLLPI